MYSLAPRCSEPWSPRSTPACCRPPSVAANALADTSRPAAKVASRMNMRERAAAGLEPERFNLVMRRHPFRHRLGLVDLGPQRHRDEEGEVKEGQDTPDDGLDRVGTRAGADLAEPYERDGQDREHHLGDPRAVANRIDLAA